jgi:hypothetical protein
MQLTPGLKECYHENMGLSIMKIAVGLALQILCSYITFPLYALVTQVKSNDGEMAVNYHHHQLFELKKSKNHTQIIQLNLVRACRWDPT